MKTEVTETTGSQPEKDKKDQQKTGGESTPDKEVGITKKDLEEIQNAFNRKLDAVLAQNKLLEDQLLVQTKATGGLSVDDLAKALHKFKKDDKDPDYNSGIDESQIPIEDVLQKDEWVTFFVPSAGFVIVDDRRQGHIVKLPFNKKIIEFKHLNTNRAEVGKHTVTTPIASYTSMSKAETAWIRKSSWYKTFIFENMQGAQVADAKRALRLGKIVEILRAKSFPELVNEANSMSVPIVNNPEEMAIRIALEMGRKEEEAEAESIRSRASEMFKDRELLGKMTTA